MNVTQISTSDIFTGGAEKIAWNLFQAYRSRGLRSWLVVGYRSSHDANVFLVPNYARHDNLLLAAGNRLSPFVGKVRGAGRLRNILYLLGQPQRLSGIWRGHEDFDFPGTRKLLELTPKPPDILHCHNLHGGYFDLCVLPWLSRQVPVLLTLHDAWLLTGHCAYPFDCERWKSRCGDCPDLNIRPAIRKDGTAYNWQRKRKVYTKSRLYIATPSEWLMDIVKQSILMRGVVETRVIPNGVDLKIYRPGNKHEARNALKIPQEARVLLVVGLRAGNDPRKDYPTVKAAALRIARELPEQRIVLICLGEKRIRKYVHGVEYWFIKYQNNPKQVATYYQAADIYLSATRADNFPNTVIESIACGTPVVATAVGGIPEQIEDGVNGFLVPPGNCEMMAARIKQLVCNQDLCKRFGAKGAEIARRRFDLSQQVDRYLSWYEEILRQGQVREAIKWKNQS